jgi:hypothetical protein
MSTLVARTSLYQLIVIAAGRPQQDRHGKRPSCLSTTHPQARCCRDVICSRLFGFGTKMGSSHGTPHNGTRLIDCRSMIDAAVWCGQKMRSFSAVLNLKDGRSVEPKVLMEYYGLLCATMGFGAPTNGRGVSHWLSKRNAPLDYAMKCTATKGPPDHRTDGK